VRELAELELAAREASSGRPVLVLLGGDSGVGKTRLVSEFEHRLTSGDEDDGVPGLGAVLFLHGGGVDQGDGELPYAPLLSALRPLVRQRHPALAALSSGSRSQLATILPGLEDEPRAHDPRSNPNDQLRLFEALLELIDRLTDAVPVVLILEDMHWSDRSTRTFAAFLARTLRQERVCVVLTYRTDELHRRHPLRPLLSELERLDRARRVELEPFDRDELGEALTDILGARPDRGLLERLFARSEGNPLYTEELLAAGLDGRGAAPQSLRDAFLLRIERLPAEAQRVARTVAVARAADEATLAVVTGLDRDALQSALRDAVAEQVLLAGSDGRFCFRHALLREALYDDLLPGERGELHIALARALEERDADAPDCQGELERTSSVASHYAAAGDQPNALRSTLVAARLAHGAYAFGEAADLVDRALELWPRVADAEAEAGQDHTELLATAAEAHRMIDDRPRSVMLINEALGELDPEREPARYAELLARQARMTWALNRGAEAVEIVERALALLPADDARVRPRLLAWLARTRFLRGRFRESIRDGEPALRTAVEAGDTVAETELLNTLGMARAALGDVDIGVDLLRRAQQVARDIEDFDSLATAYSNLADMLNVAGRTAEALEVAREGLAATPRHHARSHEWLRLTVAEMAFEAGDWQLARETMSPTPSRATGTLFMFARLRSADYALAVGDEEAAEQCLDAVADLVEVSAEPQWIGAYGAVLGELLVRRRDLEGAQRAVQRALDRLEVCTDDVMRIARVTAVGLQVEADRAQRARDLGEAAVRRDALARARIHHDRLTAAAQEGGPVERARLAQGRAELARARGRAAQKEWARAAAAWAAIDRPYPAAIARWREADALAGAGERVPATEAAGAALSAARGLGSQWLIDEVRTLSDRARLELAAGNGRADTGREEPVEADPFGLTPRERQVLALLAEGATNRQIGAALFMAEKTASVHVSRILAKLGVQGRTQAAAVAHRLHLA
jgi:DNA-binding CsgD family transcriptional regulator/tetratricopeptide (TPR) repeat protein